MYKCCFQIQNYLSTRKTIYKILNTSITYLNITIRIVDLQIVSCRINDVFEIAKVSLNYYCYLWNSIRQDFTQFKEVLTVLKQLITEWYIFLQGNLQLHCALLTWALLLASLRPSLIEDWRRSSSNSNSSRRSQRQQRRRHHHRHDEVYAVGQSELVNG